MVCCVHLVTLLVGGNISQGFVNAEFVPEDLESAFDPLKGDE